MFKKLLIPISIYYGVKMNYKYNGGTTIGFIHNNIHDKMFYKHNTRQKYDILYNGVTINDSHKIYDVDQLIVDNDVNRITIPNTAIITKYEDHYTCSKMTIESFIPQNFPFCFLDELRNYNFCINNPHFDDYFNNEQAINEIGNKQWTEYDYCLLKGMNYANRFQNVDARHLFLFDKDDANKKISGQEFNKKYDNIKFIKIIYNKCYSFDEFTNNKEPIISNKNGIQFTFDKYKDGTNCYSNIKIPDDAVITIYDSYAKSDKLILTSSCFRKN